MCSAAAMSSADEEVAIATDEGVYILVSRKVLSEIFIYMYYLSHRGIYTSDLGPQAKSAREIFLNGKQTRDISLSIQPSPKILAPTPSQ